MKKIMALMSVSILVLSCASRTLQKDYTVVDASTEEIPEWVEELQEWIEDEEEASKFRYYTYTTEAKNSRAIACEIAQARVDNKIAAEVATFIQQSFAQSKHGDPTEKNKKLSEYVQDDLVKEVRAHIRGVKYVKEYWEKRSFDKELGASKNWKGYTCAKLAKISHKQLKKLFKKADSKLKSKVKSDTKAKEHIENIMIEAAKNYTQA